MEEQSWPGVRCSADGPVGSLTLDRPERLNALDVATLHSLVEAAAWFDARPHVKAVVVSGAGRAFCAGFDLTALPPAAWTGTADESHTTSPSEVVGLGRLAADAVAGMSAVTVAAVHGACVGGGAVLVLACDLRVASTDATIALPEAALGIPLGWDGVRRLVREVGPAMTRELILTGRAVSSEEARSLGLVGRVVAPGDLQRVAREVADGVARLPRIVIDATLEQVDRATEDLLPAGDPADDVARTLAALVDPESVAVRMSYLRSRTGHG